MYYATNGFTTLSREDGLGNLMFLRHYWIHYIENKQDKVARGGCT